MTSNAHVPAPRWVPIAFHGFCWLSVVASTAITLFIEIRPKDAAPVVAVGCPQGCPQKTVCNPGTGKCDAVAVVENSDFWKYGGAVPTPPK